MALDLAKYYYFLGGGVRQSVKFSDFPNDRVGIPTINKQSAIAEFLDQEVGQVDKLIGIKKRLIETITVSRKMVALQVLDHFDAPPMLTNAETYTTGHFKNGWSVQRVKHVVAFMTSGSRGWSDFIATEGELFLQSGNIGRCMEINLVNAQRIEPQIGAEAKRTTLRPHDVLVCITGGRTGAVGFLPAIVEAAYVNQHICLLRARSAVIKPKLLAHFLYSEVGQKQFSFFQYGLKQGLGFTQVGEVKIPIPPPTLQDCILRQIESEVSRMDHLVGHLSVSIERLYEFRSAIITAAVTGQIDVATWSKGRNVDRQLNAIKEKLVA